MLFLRPGAGRLGQPGIFLGPLLPGFFFQPADLSLGLSQKTLSLGFGVLDPLVSRPAGFSTFSASSRSSSARFLTSSNPGVDSGSGNGLPLQQFLSNLKAFSSGGPRRRYPDPGVLMPFNLPGRIKEPGSFHATYLNQVKTPGAYIQDWVMLGIYGFRHDENLCICGLSPQ